MWLNWRLLRFLECVSSRVTVEQTAFRKKSIQRSVSLVVVVVLMLTVSLRARRRPRADPKNCTQRLFQTGASPAQSRDTDWTLWSSSTHGHWGSPQAAKPLYQMSPAAQERRDSTGPFLTRGFRESRPPLRAWRSSPKLDSGSKKETEYAKGKKQTLFHSFSGNSPHALPALWCIKSLYTEVFIHYIITTCKVIYRVHTSNRALPANTRGTWCASSNTYACFYSSWFPWLGACSSRVPGMLRLCSRCRWRPALSTGTTGTWNSPFAAFLYPAAFEVPPLSATTDSRRGPSVHLACLLYTALPQMEENQLRL